MIPVRGQINHRLKTNMDSKAWQCAGKYLHSHVGNHIDTHVWNVVWITLVMNVGDPIKQTLMKHYDISNR